MSALTERLRELRIIPVIAVEDENDILPLAGALRDNGLPAAEITFRSAAAAGALRRARKAFPDMLIGAGTVLNREQVLTARDAGASFIVSPGFNPNTVCACLEADIEIIPGVNNPSTIEAALEMGLTALKFFPAEASGGVKMIKALLGPYAGVEFMPTGGIGPSNLRDYLSVPQVLACGGSWMADRKLIESGNWEEIGRLTAEAAALARQN